MPLLRPTEQFTHAASPVLRDAAVEEAFARAKAGDRASFGKVAQQLQVRLYNIALRMLGNADDAGEVVQETFAKGLASLDSHRGESGAYTWLCRIAMNLAISRKRQAHSRGRTMSIDAETASDQSSALRQRLEGREPSPEETAERSEEVVRVREALARVTPEHRAVLVMREIDGMDYQEIADVLELPLNTLKSRLFRAREELRKELMKSEKPTR